MSDYRTKVQSSLSNRLLSSVSADFSGLTQEVESREYGFSRFTVQERGGVLCSSTVDSILQDSTIVKGFL